MLITGLLLKPKARARTTKAVSEIKPGLIGPKGRGFLLQIHGLITKNTLDLPSTCQFAKGHKAQGHILKTPSPTQIEARKIQASF